jgi:hypothetical protein
MMKVWRQSQYGRQCPARARKGLAFACFAMASCLASSVAAQKVTVGAEVAEVVAASAEPSLPQTASIRELDLVIVIGFRLRSTAYDLRMQSVISGYSELVEKADCVTLICGFVVQEGTKWRATNVVSGEESELRDKASNMEREGTTLVIVHPSGVKRVVPQF